jgi:hypothetical protein
MTASLSLLAASLPHSASDPLTTSLLLHPTLSMGKISAPRTQQWVIKGKLFLTFPFIKHRHTHCIETNIQYGYSLISYEGSVSQKMPKKFLSRAIKRRLRNRA